MLQDGVNLKADVLKVAHHGSSYSTSTHFLQAVSPRYAVISAGKDNQYGHPTQSVLNRLQKAGTGTLRTDEAGTIVIKSDGTSLSGHIPASHRER